MNVRLLSKRYVLLVALLAMAAILVSTCAAPVSEKPSAAVPQVEPLTEEALRNAEYHGIYADTAVQLTDGKYEGEPFVEGGASRPTVVFTPFFAFGDLNGDGVDDAVVALVENSGGSGSFWYLSAVLNVDGQPKNVATEFLSDRGRVETITIVGGQATVDRLDHAPSDPMCCPSLQIRDVYELQGDTLVQLSHKELVPVALALEALKNAEYHGIYADTAVQLTDGKYEGEPFVEGGASRPTVVFTPFFAFGDLNGDGVDEAVVALVESSGGSGSFWYLSAVLNVDGQPKNVATEFLSDRGRVETITIVGGQAIVDRLDHAPSDPMCCPSLQTRDVYELQGDTLVQLSHKELAPVALTLEALKNAQYQGIYKDTVVQLSDGYYEGEPFVEGGASRPTMTFIEPSAFGDLNGDGVGDAAVLLVENSGGSGSFVYLAALVNHSGAPVNVASHLLGDRARPQALTIGDGVITIDMVAHGPQDPMCCPSQQIIETYQLQGDSLTQLSHEEKQVVDLTGLVDITWKWERLVSSTGRDEIAVPNPLDYLLELYDDGLYSATADCNRASGGYTIDGESLALLPGPTTLAECEPGSLYYEYLAYLGLVESYSVQSDELSLKLEGDGPTMHFRRVVDLTGLVDITWKWERLASSTGQDEIAVPNPLDYLLELYDDGLYSATADCNRASGGYTIDGESLALLPGPTTLAECEPGSLYYEYLAYLGLVESYSVQSDELLLKLEGDGPTMHFRRVVDLTGLVDITWKWERLVSSTGQDEIAVPNPLDYLLELYDDGLYSATADCNRASGGYTIGGESLALLPGPTTLAECEPGSLYYEYLAYLGLLESYSVQSDELLLKLEGDGPTMHFRRHVSK